MKSIILKLLSICLLLNVLGVAAQETIPAYNTYGTVPFVDDYKRSDEKNGLAADLVDYLNSQLKGKYFIQLQTIPRERLNQKIISNPKFKGVVLFANPLFVGDADKTKFLWTTAITKDKNYVISSLQKKVEYVDSDSFKNLLFIGIRGHKYKGLDDRFGKDIQRIDVGTELQPLRLIAAGRGDVTIMASNVYNYLMKVNGEQDGLNGKLYVSAKPHLEFDRFMFVSHENAELAKDLSNIATAMQNDPEWKSIQAKYGSK